MTVLWPVPYRTIVRRMRRGGQYGTGVRYGFGFTVFMTSTGRICASFVPHYCLYRTRTDYVGDGSVRRGGACRSLAVITGVGQSRDLPVFFCCLSFFNCFHPVGHN